MVGLRGSKFAYNTLINNKYLDWSFARYPQTKPAADHRPMAAAQFNAASAEVYPQGAARNHLGNWHI